MGIINERIKERRTYLGLTLLEVAEFLEVKEATAQRYESGAIKNIGHETIVKLSHILKCTPSYLMGWEDFSVEISEELTASDKNNFALSDLEKEIITKFRGLQPGERTMFLGSLGIKEEQKGDVVKVG